MAVSLDVGPSITVHGDASTSRRSGRVRKPTAKVRVVEQVSYQDNAELKEEINKLSNLVQDLLRRDAEREQFLKDCLRKIESLERELQEEKKRSDRHQRGLARSMHAVSTGPSESALGFQGHPLHTAQNQPPQVRSYATVASQQLTRKLHEPTPAKQAANRAASKDLRIFARLPPESPLRNERAYDIYIFVREKLSPQAREALKGIDHVKTGLALLPSSADGTKVLLDNREQIATLLQAEAIEQRDTWIRAYIANVPYTRHCLLTNTELEITTEELLEEIQATTKLKPEKAYFSRKDEAERLGTVTAWFKAEAVRQLPRRLRLMGASVFVNLQFPKEKRSPQCHRCGGFHNERTCTRRKRCLKCSSPSHTADQHRAPCGGTEGHDGCDCPFKCPSCNGPHAAFDVTCPIKPKVVKGVVQRRNKAQLRAIRAEGERSWRFATQQSHHQSREGGEEMDCNQANEGHQENAAL
ncbi:putative reverse transcriptase [Colletotrichum tofieldiae]|nr:putative reverse transcriptase [Colletotrichum tofieldiae]